MYSISIRHNGPFFGLSLRHLHTFPNFVGTEKPKLSEGGERGERAFLGALGEEKCAMIPTLLRHTVEPNGTIFDMTQLNVTRRQYIFRYDKCVHPYGCG